MAQRLVSLGTKVVSSSTRLAFKSVELGQAAAVRARPHLTWLWANRAELTPPGPSQWPQIKQGLRQVLNTTVTGRFLDKPMKEVAVNSLIGLEIFGWFIVGEMIGRRSIIGYKV